MGQVFTNSKKDQSSKGNIYSIDLGEKKVIRMKKKMFTHYKESVVTRGNIACSPLSHVWK
jgi:hypothetical protein